MLVCYHINHIHFISKCICLFITSVIWLPGNKSKDEGKDQEYIKSVQTQILSLAVKLGYTQASTRERYSQKTTT